MKQYLHRTGVYLFDVSAPTKEVHMIKVTSFHGDTVCFEADLPITNTVFQVKRSENMPADDADAKLLAQLLTRPHVSQAWSGRELDESGREVCDGSLYCLLSWDEDDDRESETITFVNSFTRVLNARLGYPESTEPCWR